MATATRIEWDALYVNKADGYLLLAYYVLLDTNYPEVAAIVLQAREQLRALAILKNSDHFLP
jgi:hypothetical protein